MSPANAYGRLAHYITSSPMHSSTLSSDRQSMFSPLSSAAPLSPCHLRLVRAQVVEGGTCNTEDSLPRIVSSQNRQKWLSLSASVFTVFSDGKAESLSPVPN